MIHLLLRFEISQKLKNKRKASSSEGEIQDEKVELIL